MPMEMADLNSVLGEVIGGVVKRLASVRLTLRFPGRQHPVKMHPPRLRGGEYGVNAARWRQRLD